MEKRIFYNGEELQEGTFGLEGHLERGPLWLRLVVSYGASGPEKVELPVKVEKIKVADENGDPCVYLVDVEPPAQPVSGGDQLRQAMAKAQALQKEINALGLGPKPDRRWGDHRMPYWQRVLELKFETSDLSPAEQEWLMEWARLELSLTFRSDEQQRLIRYGHYMGWMVAQRRAEE